MNPNDDALYNPVFPSLALVMGRPVTAQSLDQRDVDLLLALLAETGFTRITGFTITDLPQHLVTNALLKIIQRALANDEVAPTETSASSTPSKSAQVWQTVAHLTVALAAAGRVNMPQLVCELSQSVSMHSGRTYASNALIWLFAQCVHAVPAFVSLIKASTLAHDRPSLLMRIIAFFDVQRNSLSQIASARETLANSPLDFNSCWHFVCLTALPALLRRLFVDDANFKATLEADVSANPHWFSLVQHLIPIVEKLESVEDSLTKTPPQQKQLSLQEFVEIMVVTTVTARRVSAAIRTWLELGIASSSPNEATNKADDDILNEDGPSKRARTEAPISVCTNSSAMLLIPFKQRLLFLNNLVTLFENLTTHITPLLPNLLATFRFCCCTVPLLSDAIAERTHFAKPLILATRLPLSAQHHVVELLKLYSHRDMLSHTLVETDAQRKTILAAVGQIVPHSLAIARQLKVLVLGLLDTALDARVLFGHGSALWDPPKSLRFPSCELLGRQLFLATSRVLRCDILPGQRENIELSMQPWMPAINFVWPSWIKEHIHPMLTAAATSNQHIVEVLPSQEALEHDFAAQLPSIHSAYTSPHLAPLFHPTTPAAAAESAATPSTPDMNQSVESIRRAISLRQIDARLLLAVVAHAWLSASASSSIQLNVLAFVMSSAIPPEQHEIVVANLVSYTLMHMRNQPEGAQFVKDWWALKSRSPAKATSTATATTSDTPVFPNVPPVVLNIIELFHALAYISCLPACDEFLLWLASGSPLFAMERLALLDACLNDPRIVKQIRNASESDTVEPTARFLVQSVKQALERMLEAFHYAAMERLLDVYVDLLRPALIAPLRFVTYLANFSGPDKQPPLSVRARMQLLSLIDPSVTPPEHGAAYVPPSSYDILHELTESYFHDIAAMSAPDARRHVLRSEHPSRCASAMLVARARVLMHVISPDDFTEMCFDESLGQGRSRLLAGCLLAHLSSRFWNRLLRTCTRLALTISEAERTQSSEWGARQLDARVEHTVLVVRTLVCFRPFTSRNLIRHILDANKKTAVVARAVLFLWRCCSTRLGHEVYLEVPRIRELLYQCLQTLVDGCRPLTLTSSAQERHAATLLQRVLAHIEAGGSSAPFIIKCTP